MMDPLHTLETCVCVYSDIFTLTSEDFRVQDSLPDYCVVVLVEPVRGHREVIGVCRHKW